MPDIFDVVADTTRRDILAILLKRRAHPTKKTNPKRGASVSEIVSDLGLSQPTVSKHLKVLREAGLVTVQEQGQHRYYSLETGPLETVGSWVAPFVKAPLVASETQHAAETVDFLAEESRAIATKMGKVAADTSFHVTSMVDTVNPKRWRKSGANSAVKQ